MMSTTTTKLIALLIVLATVGPPALALDITVTLTSDTNDGFPPYSLRDAIILANVSPGEDTIYLGAYSYGLTIPGLNEVAAYTGALDITESATHHRRSRTRGNDRRCRFPRPRLSRRQPLSRGLLPRHDHHRRGAHPVQR